LVMLPVLYLLYVRAKNRFGKWGTGYSDLGVKPKKVHELMEASIDGH
jgi:hypothetical protein